MNRLYDNDVVFRKLTDLGWSGRAALRLVKQLPTDPNRLKEVPSSGAPFFNLVCSAGFSGHSSFDLHGREAPQVISVGAEFCLNVASTQADEGGGDGGHLLPKYRLRRIQRALRSESSTRELRAKINQLLTDESRRVLGPSWSIFFAMTCREWTAHRIQEVLVRDRASKSPPRLSRRQWVPHPMTYRNLQVAAVRYRGDLLRGFESASSSGHS